MAPLLRGRGPRCHYCNKWSERRNVGVRHFLCEECQAENFLDENGEVEDVPTKIASFPHPSPLFAQALLNDQTAVDQSPFCTRCLSNQHILNETLANYLPSLDHPDYSQHEASYPEFRRQLEDRYPPICASCEPRVRKTIEQAGYMAKSDNLRRIMQRSRARRTAHSWDWRHLALVLGRVSFWTSIAGQLLWNLMSVLEDIDERTILNGATSMPRPIHCIGQVVTYRTDAGCSTALDPIATAALILGVLSAWWNPRWKHRLEGCEGRLVGLWKYYQLTFAVIMLRFAFWAWAIGLTRIPSTKATRQIGHSFFMIMTPVLVMHITTRVQVDTTPLVTWQDPQLRLLSQHQSLEATPSPRVAIVSTRPNWPQPHTSRTFPVGTLAPESRLETRKRGSEATSGHVDLDAMDWEPSPNFRPESRTQPPKKVGRPSPFYGVLPPRPTNRLLRATERSAHLQANQEPRLRESIGLPPGFFDNSDHLVQTSMPSALQPMAPPKFFSRSDRDTDTGLEGMFDSIFSLNDASATPKGRVGLSTAGDNEPTPQKPGDDVSPPTGRTQTQTRLPSIAKLITFSIGLLMVNLSLRVEYVPHISAMVLIAAGAFQLWTAVLEMKRPKSKRAYSSVIGSIVMATGAMYLLIQQWRCSRGDCKLDRYHDQWTVFFLLFASVWEFVQLFENLLSASQNEPGCTSHIDPPENQLVGELTPSQAHKAQHARSPVELWNQPPTNPKDQASRFSEFGGNEKPSLPSDTATCSSLAELNTLQGGRRDSGESTATQSSVSTETTTTTDDWRTPNFRASRPRQEGGYGSRYSLRSLNLDDTILQPREQSIDDLISSYRARR